MRARAAALACVLGLVCGACSDGGGTDTGVAGSTDTTASGTTATTLPLAARLCSAPEPEPVGTLEPDGLVELSGLVADPRRDDTFIAHNDSGDTARVFVVDGAGRALDEIAVDGVTPFDWEDVAVHDDVVYVGDIGDNARARSSVVVASFVIADAVGGAVTATPITLTYPDGPHDAEALMVDPVTESLVIVTKELAGDSGVYASPLTQPGSLEPVTTLDLGVAELVTAGDIAADGSAIALRTYGKVFVWERRGAESLADVFAREPCTAPSPIEPQGEALALTQDGYVTISEGAHPPVWRVTAGAPAHPSVASAPGTSSGG